MILEYENWVVLKTVSNEIRNDDIKNNFNHVVKTLKQLGVCVEEVEIPVHLAKAILPTYTLSLIVKQQVIIRA